VKLVEAYMKEQGLFHTPDAPEPVYSDTLELNLATVEPSMADAPAAGSGRPARMPRKFAEALPTLKKPSPTAATPPVRWPLGG